ncbi:C6 transcription factor [Paraphaeosphaeria minitans]|uniref:C6 transcription factor n=1 Tax=Paraphaeosphaeria minitans TaxID=565426 RepID=A0A9P6GPH6_9PLEO|nr:C6 transcription factor [Paraphaeosphaeria minitans]
MALHSINDPISQQEVDYTISTLLLALQGLREQSRNYYITKTAYYILKDQLRLEEARLLQDSEDPETAVDESPGLLGEIQSAWTPRIIDISDDPVAEELSKLVKQYLGLASDRQSDNGTDYD